MNRLIPILCVAVMLAGLTFTLTAGQLQRQRLQGQADKYREICRGVREQLRVDQRLLLTPERGLVLSRFGGACGDDSFVMLERCLPSTFDMTHWHDCATRDDIRCLSSMLVNAAASLEDL